MLTNNFTKSNITNMEQEISKIDYKLPNSVKSPISSAYRSELKIIKIR